MLSVLLESVSGVDISSAEFYRLFNVTVAAGPAGRSSIKFTEGNPPSSPGKGCKRTRSHTEAAPSSPTKKSKAKKPYFAANITEKTVANAINHSGEKLVSDSDQDQDRDQEEPIESGNNGGEGSSSSTSSIGSNTLQFMYHLSPRLVSAKCKCHFVDTVFNETFIYCTLSDVNEL